MKKAFFLSQLLAFDENLCVETWLKRFSAVATDTLHAIKDLQTSMESLSAAVGDFRLECGRGETPSPVDGGDGPPAAP